MIVPSSSHLRLSPLRFDPISAPTELPFSTTLRCGLHLKLGRRGSSLTKRLKARSKEMVWSGQDSRRRQRKRKREKNWRKQIRFWLETRRAGLLPKLLERWGMWIHMRETNLIIEQDNVEVRRSLIEEMKAKKNAVCLSLFFGKEYLLKAWIVQTEIEGFRQCHIRDGAALVRYLAWLEEALENGESWTEYDAATKLEDFRKWDTLSLISYLSSLISWLFNRENKLFMGLSFETISSTGANAAVIHYSPPEKGSKVIEKKQMYLCDSGGQYCCYQWRSMSSLTFWNIAQYLDGTTDVTRTLVGQSSVDWFFWEKLIPYVAFRHTQRGPKARIHPSGELHQTIRVILVADPGALVARTHFLGYYRFPSGYNWYVNFFLSWESELITCLGYIL